MSSPLPISVVVCTHNPRPEYFRRTIAALAEQDLARDQWELLVIDNASSKPVSELSDLSWHPSARVIVESRLGLTSARLRGIAESRGDVVIFVDDDNVLDREFLKNVVSVSGSFPFLGAWGGAIQAEFETQPQEWTRNYLQLLAISDVPRDVWSNRIDDMTAVPCGAGLCVRRRVAEEYASRCSTDARRLEFDRKGASLSSCGDSDLALTSIDLGLGTGRFRSLKLLHLIPSGRVELQYLVRLNEDLAASYVALCSIRGVRTPSGPPQRRALSRLLHAYHRFRIGPEHCAMNDARDRGIERGLASQKQVDRGIAPSGQKE